MATLRQKVIRLAHGKPELRPHLIPILKQSGKSLPFNINDVTDALESMYTARGGRLREVEWDKTLKGWFADPQNRERPDYYEDEHGEEGWDYWDENYAQPVAKEIGERLSKKFGKGIFTVGIGEKGHVEVGLTAKYRSMI